MFPLSFYVQEENDKNSLKTSLERVNCLIGDAISYFLPVQIDRILNTDLQGR